MNHRSQNDEMAAQWVARMDAETWSARDEAELQAWLSADPSRSGLMLATQAAWLSLDRAEADGIVEAEAVPAHRGLWHRRKLLAGMAASAAGIGIAGRELWLASNVAYATKVGEIRRVPLADGSVMMINSASALKVQIGKHAREVELAEGEAWFEVAKDASRPFIVGAGRAKAQAVGTAFSVRVLENGTEVQVTEGIVEAWCDDDQAAKLRLAAGERALITPSAVVRYATADLANVDRTLAWRNGMIDLNGRTLAEAADEFNRYNARQIVIADPNIAAEQFDGVFRIDDPDGFVNAVKSSLDVTISSEDPSVIRILGKT